MKANIHLIPQKYGKVNWELHVVTDTLERTFQLGEDEQFCLQSLGADVEVIYEAIDSKDISPGTIGNRKLAKYICAALDITPETLPKIDSIRLLAF